MTGLNEFGGLQDGSDRDDQTVYKPLPPTALERGVGWGLATVILLGVFGLCWLVANAAVVLGWLP